MGKTVLFTFDTPVGSFWIHPEPGERVRLGIGNHQLGTYRSPSDAARAVYQQTTGWKEWDGLRNIKRPASLREWKRGAVFAERRKAAGRGRAPEDE